MKEKTRAYPFLAAPVSQHQEQKGICHADWRLQGRHHTAPFTNATELPASKSAKGNTQGFGQEFGASVSRPQHHPHYCLLKYLQGPCPATATSAHRANKHFPAIRCDKWGFPTACPSAQQGKAQRHGPHVPLAA